MSSTRQFEHLELLREGAVTRVVMNRPEVHNAFNQRVIEELDAAFLWVQDEPTCRVVVLEGRGSELLCRR